METLRTATHLTDHFLKLNGFEIIATASEVVEMVSEIESDQWTLERLVHWFRAHTQSMR